jgi:LuxR family maltose regulon positive regulatory protein
MTILKPELNNLVYFNDKIVSQLKRILFYPCTLLEAPTGYGKTTVVHEYLKSENIRVL